MDLDKITKELGIPEDDGACNHLENFKIPAISLPNQDGNMLKLNRLDTFRLVLYCYPMTGSPDKPLPINWNNIPGAKGCTSENCGIRDNYDKILTLNAIPIGVTSQFVDEIKEMTSRLNITHDILSDVNLELTKKIKLPTFKVENRVFLQRITLIVEKSIIKKIFYPIFSPNKHIYEVIKWLKHN